MGRFNCHSVAVAILFTVKIEGLDLGFLPPIYASLNALTAIGLIVAIVAIKRKNRKLHQRVIQVCLIFSILFLLLYVLYHMTSDTTPGGWHIKNDLFLSIDITYFTEYGRNTNRFICIPFCLARRL